jgi:hypothetical protein
MDGTERALTQTLAKLRDVTTQRDDACRLLSQERAAQERAAAAPRGDCRPGCIALMTMRRERDAARALVRAAATIIEYGINRLDDDIAIREQCAWLDKARALLAEAGIGDGAA